MADFLPAFEAVIKNEGGYKLTDVAADRGGQTYAGIARKPNPQWRGWAYIDRGDTPPSELVRQFYKENFWDRVRGDDLLDQSIAFSVFDSAVNAGVSTSSKLAQIVVGATPDGKIGEKSLALLNETDPFYFRMAFTIAKIARYRDICLKDASQKKFLLGWIARALKGLA